MLEVVQINFNYFRVNQNTRKGSCRAAFLPSKRFLKSSLFLSFLTILLFSLSISVFATDFSYDPDVFSYTGSWTDPTNATDNDINTGALPLVNQSTLIFNRSTAIINKSEPVNWFVEFTNSTTTQLHLLPLDCYNYDFVVTRVLYFTRNNVDFPYGFSLQCLNSTGYQELMQPLVSKNLLPLFREEEIWLSFVSNVSGSSVGGSGGDVSDNNPIMVSFVDVLFTGGILDILEAWNPSVYHEMIEAWKIIFDDLNLFPQRVLDALSLSLKYTLRQPAALIKDPSLGGEI